MHRNNRIADTGGPAAETLESPFVLLIFLLNWYFYNKLPENKVTDSEIIMIDPRYLTAKMIVCR